MIDYSSLTPLVEKVASAVHSSFPGHHDVDDTRQTIWLWVFENKGTVAEILRNTERPEGVLYNLMTKEANGFLKKEDAASYGYSEEDTFHYPLGAVKDLLTDIFDYEDWQSFAMKGDGQPSSKAQANMTGDRLAMLVDVKSAVEKLNEDQYNTIVWTYKYNYTAENLADELGITTEAAKKRTQRAVAAVQRRLGTKPLSQMRGGHGATSEDAMYRGRIGNAEAQYINDRNYEG